MTQATKPIITQKVALDDGSIAVMTYPGGVTVVDKNHSLAQTPTEFCHCKLCRWIYLREVVKSTFED